MSHIWYVDVSKCTYSLPFLAGHVAIGAVALRLLNSRSDTRISENYCGEAWHLRLTSASSNLKLRSLGQ
jgi:hypothetical protein